MHDIRLIRENPATFDAHMARLGLSPLSETILDLDKTWRDATTRAGSPDRAQIDAFGPRDQ